MSLFDVLKYGGIDTDKWHEIETLPTELLHKFYRSIYSYCRMSADPMSIPRSYMCQEIAFWSNNNKKDLFIETLEDWNNEPV